MSDTFTEILIANRFFIYVVWTSAIFEKTLGLYLLVNGFTRQMSDNAAFAYRINVTGLYFLLMNGVMIYDLVIREVEYKDFSYFLWFVFVGVLTFGVYKFVDKFQGRADKRKKRVRKVASI